LPNRYDHSTKAIIVLLSGCGILYCLWHAPIDVPHEWAEWIIVNIVALFAIPMLTIVCFMDDGPKEFGFRWGDTGKSWKWIGAMLLFMSPFFVMASMDQGFRDFYPRYLPARESAVGFFVLVVTIGVYMFCWEYFFRGFMLFGMAPAFGRIAIVLQAIPFGLSHFGNPAPEVLGSFIAGIALGELSWRFKSFVPSFIVHWTAYVAFNLLVVLQNR